ncbi:uncharacterized protein LOC142238949 [Haematobia irritans]|uniref:uncharacterized protein LOC142238949 n=1 Tax=Haematobia irritans TaxID=7368 RepID=UPI003F501315
MIGTDEMSSSTGMDISESFRPEDISKTDFFDFVTAPDMGIGLGVNVNLHHTHHNHHHHNHHTITSPQQQQHQHQSQHHHHHLSPQQQQHLHQHQHHSQPTHHNPDSSPMTHDGGGTGGPSGGGGGGSSSVTSVSANGNDSHGDTSGLSDGSSASTTDPTLHGYEFWASDKEHTSTIFEDLDRYCWQQQSNSNATTASTVTVPNNGTANNSTTTANNSSNQMHHVPSPANSLNPLHSSLVNPSSPHHHHSPVVTPVSTTASSSLPTTPVSQTQLNSDGTISNIISTDGQIYTLTVLNGNEPWLKRETDTNLQSTLDLDSLLGTFPGYIKSEYPYDDSGFSTDGCKDLNGDSGNIMGTNSQRLPSLLNTISSVTSSGGLSGVGGLGTDSAVTAALSIGQQLDQFHNNNNDWHMTDHNNEQNSAESLLRSALQGKGYTKGLHMHNGIALMPSSPSVKDDDMRRILFPVDADGLNFSDTSLSATQIFDDTQNATGGHNTHMIVPHSPVTNGPLTPVTNSTSINQQNSNNNVNANGHTGGSNQTNSMLVDDMFLTLENAFSDDFEKIKQFCNANASANEYHHHNSEGMMQLSPNVTGGAVAQTTGTSSMNSISVTTGQQQLQALHTTGLSSTPAANATTMVVNPVQQQNPPPQPLKPEVTTSSQRIGPTGKITKKYKRTLSSHGSGVSNNNNNNPNAINHNNNNNSSNLSTSKGTGANLPLANGSGGGGVNRNGSASSGSSTTSSNSPTHCNGGNGVGGGNSSSSTTTTTSSTSSSTSGGQRKERSLHYCSICSKGFKDKYSVNVHIRTHTGEKPFACTLCGKSFRQKAHLAKHYQTHMAQKNNGNLVKGNSNKHHRSSAAAAAAAAAAVVQQQQQQQQQQGLNSSPLIHNHHQRPINSAPTTPTTPTLPHGLGMVNGLLTTSSGLTLGLTQQSSSLASSAPSTPTTTILPPANGLLANR